jgi:hypothetical protein
VAARDAAGTLPTTSRGVATVGDGRYSFAAVCGSKGRLSRSASSLGRRATARGCHEPHIRQRYCARAGAPSRTSMTLIARNIRKRALAERLRARRLPHLREGA